MTIEKSQIEGILGGIVDVNMEADLVASKAVKSIEVDGNNCRIAIRLGYPAAGYFDELRQQIVDAVSALDGIGEIGVEIESQVKSHAVQQNLKPLQGIK
ncbi:MAG TPA: iron-sulfur cluster assembly protein, partial [Gammaproteobacteria bacterium]